MALPYEWNFVDGNELLGLNKSTEMDAWYPEIAELDGEIYAVWFESSGSFDQIRVQRFDGTTWTFVDGDGETGINYDIEKSAQNVCLVASNDELYAFWDEEEEYYTPQIRARKYDGSNWIFVDGNQELGLNKNISKSADYPKAIAANDEIYVVWREGSRAAYQIRVKKYGAPVGEKDYTVMYSANGGYSGLEPMHPTNYDEGEEVTVLGNEDDFVRDGYAFEGWNTKRDGSGNDYEEEDTLAIETSDILLFAKWTANPTYTVTYNSNGATSGAVPTDFMDYEEGDTVLVRGNENNLARTGYTFAGWNTQADGNGTSYPEGESFSIGSSNVTLYAEWTPVSSGGSSNRHKKEKPKGVEIIINGKAQTAATQETKKQEDKTIITITIDDKKIEEKLQASGSNSTIVIPVNNKADVVAGELNGQTVKNMEQKEAILEIKTENTTYTLPASEINIDSISSQIGEQVELKDIKVSIIISEPPADTVKIVEDIANKNSYQIVVKPIEFNITCTYGDKTVEVAKFNGYVERTIEIPEGIDPSKITTGIILNDDGTFSHVPTTIVVVDRKYYAKINSLTNSTYSVIYSPKTFADVENHWAKTDVNDMASRLVIDGVDENTFEPNRDITRAEFAAIVVRGLGLMRPGTGKDVFKDVTKNDWYYDAVSIAKEYGLIEGHDNELFAPDEKITREDAMVVIARAMKITKLDTKLSTEEVERQIGRFIDSNNISDYAKESIAACTKNKVVVGDNNALNPRANIIRAEAATILKRLLEKSKLI